MPQTFWPLSCFPALEAGLAVREHVDAGGVVARLDDADGFAPLVRHVHGGEHQVDLALLQELHAVRRDDRLELELDAEPVGHVLGEVGLEADDGAGRVTEAERLVVGLGADDEHAALLDLFECLCRERARRGGPSNDDHAGDGEAFAHGPLPSPGYRIARAFRKTARNARSYSNFLEARKLC